MSFSNGLGRKAQGSHICGGSSAATDRHTQLDAEGKLRDTYGTLRDLGSKLTGKGGTDVSAGITDTERASKYYSDILSGDMSKILGALGPQIKAITSTADAQKKESAQGGDRTGGKNPGLQALDADVRSQVGDMVSKERGSAAGGLERTGSQRSGVGLTETGQGLGSITSAGNIASTLESNAIQSRQVSKKIHDDAVQAWGDVIASVLFGV